MPEWVEWIVIFKHIFMQHILSKRFWFFIISGGLALFSIGMIFFGNLNLGIDMTGGTQSEYRYTDYEFSQETLATQAQEVALSIDETQNIITTVNLYKITGEESFVVEAGFTRNLSEEEIESYKVDYRDTLEQSFQELGSIELTKYTNIGASFGDYIRNTAFTTLIIAIVGIALYIAYTFSGTVSGISSLSFALITIITLFHDVLISTGLYILTSSFFPHFQIDTFFITALLTILGYSINDTIVIFDRIRSNLQEFGGKGKNLHEIIELSVSQTLTRSIYTSLTLAFVLLCILIFGPESIGGFTLAMMFGTIVGTYSSIFIASPLLFEIHKNTVLSEYVKREELSEEDKMVV
ncbi:protein translocase subunit SecF [Candidatus Gracilibacteria bacterium]|nr:protein translocase subunit SecF [Candidatus Gracilibacteria bacterium]